MTHIDLVVHFESNNNHKKGGFKTMKKLITNFSNKLFWAKNLKEFFSGIMFFIMSVTIGSALIASAFTIVACLMMLNGGELTMANINQIIASL